MSQELETKLKGNSVVALLVINKIKNLPTNAIYNILENTGDLIVVGYINDQDIVELPKGERVIYLRIPTEILDWSTNSGQKYLPFDNQDFFVLVAYKWELFRLLFGLGVAHIIYSDLDVAWFTNVSQILKDAHEATPEVKFFIQSATIFPSNPQLCMGLASMLNCPEVLALIKECFSVHRSRALSGEMIGDDDVVTDYYREHAFVSWIKELPQSTFPVGMLFNLVQRTSKFPGLISRRPFMFHANFVVGLENKELLLRVVSGLIQGRTRYSNLGFRQLLRLLIKSFRQRRRDLFKSSG